MSSVTSAHRLPPANPVDREAPDHNWCTYLLGGLAIVAAAYLFAFFVAFLGGAA